MFGLKYFLLVFGGTNFLCLIIKRVKIINVKNWMSFHLNVSVIYSYFQLSKRGYFEKREFVTP